MEKITLFKVEDLAETPIPETLAIAWNRVLGSNSFLAWHSILELLELSVQLATPLNPYLDNIKTLLSMCRVIIRDMMDERLVEYE